MQVSVKLQGPFSYSFIPIIIVLVIIVGLAIYFIKTRKVKKEEITKVIIKENKKDINKIKLKYLKKLKELEKQTQSEHYSIRKSYQKLSKIIRYFVFEVTGIKVHNYTLNEIKPLNMPQLYELIKEYYSPEFARNSKGGILESIEKTGEVIKKWN